MSLSGPINGGGGPSYYDLTLEDLKAHIDKLSMEGWEEEFNYIERASETDTYLGDYTCALKNFNRGKNRYSNVLALEKTRVRLPEVEGVNGSDYINANHLDGEIPGSERTYIAAQGPLESTVEDFWRMVWSERAMVIVMLTSLVENDRPKCHRYYPSTESTDQTCTFGSFKLRLLNKEKHAHLRVRKLSVEFLPTHETRTIFHFQYTEWPDHGLPQSTKTFRELLHLVDEHNTPATGTGERASIVVHCSAGIGRSGTFCAVHSTLAKYRHLKGLHRGTPGWQPKFNILAAVLRLRSQRMGIVQTKEQYMFCYKTVLEAVLEEEDAERQQAAATGGASSSSSAGR